LNLRDALRKGKVIPMREEESRIIRLHSNDNVVVATGHFEPNSTVEAGHIVIQQTIPHGHKIATETIHRGAFIRKYGHPIPEMLIAYPNVDGVVGPTQTGGCGSAPKGGRISDFAAQFGGLRQPPEFLGCIIRGPWL
jgi:hypothetical protein